MDRDSKTGRPPRPVTPSGIITDKLAALVLQAKAMPELDPVFRQTLEEAACLAGGLDPYVAACTTTQSVELAQLAADTQGEDWNARYSTGATTVALEPEMLSGHVEGQFLKLLVHAMKARRILEIGVFTGYSALAMAEAMPEGGVLIACELDPFAAGVAARAFDRSPHGHKIRLRIGDAVRSMQQLNDAGEAFDLIFIDADKGNYPRYFAMALDGCLLAPGGLICVDNTLMQGQPYLPGEPTANGRAIADFNRMVADDPRVEQVLLPLRDGLTLIRRV